MSDFIFFSHFLTSYCFLQLNSYSSTNCFLPFSFLSSVRPLLSVDSSAGNGRKSAQSSSRSQSSAQQQQQSSNPGPQTSITFPAAGQIEVEDSIANTTRSFAFNVVFEPEASQEEVFEHSGVKRLTDMALDGFACTVFAYGQTSTGKTYTLTGNLFQVSIRVASFTFHYTILWENPKPLSADILIPFLNSSAYFCLAFS